MDPNRTPEGRSTPFWQKLLFAIIAAMAVVLAGWLGGVRFYVVDGKPITEPTRNVEAPEVPADEPPIQPPADRATVDWGHDPSIIADLENPRASSLLVKIPKGYDFVWVVSWTRNVSFNGRYYAPPTTLISYGSVRITGMPCDNDLGQWAVSAMAFKGYTPEEVFSSEQPGCDKGINVQIIDANGNFRKYTGYCGNMT